MPDENGLPLREDAAAVKQPLLGDKLYDFTKDLTTIYLPALVTLYAGLAVLWEWPFTDKVVASMGLIITFLGVVLKISSNRVANLPAQYDGALIANDPDPDKDTYRLEFDKNLPEMANQKTVTLKVVDLLPQDPSA